MMNAQQVKTPTCYKLIYVFAIDDIYHQGMLKIGDASIDYSGDISQLTPNCELLNIAAHERIKQYTTTAAVPVRLVYTELALQTGTDSNNKRKLFRDHDVHRVLENSGFKKLQPNGSNSLEWFKVTESIAKAAIAAARDGRNSLTGAEVTEVEHYTLRVEQEDAIKKTLEKFKKPGSSFLWNAKMRFGKTISCLTLVQRGKYRKVIIATHRPVVGSGWLEDFYKVFHGDNTYQFIFKDKESGETDDADNSASDQKNDLILRNNDLTGASFIYFASIQDLRGSKRVGGKYDKNNAVFDMEWDLVIVDEAHEGTKTELGRTVQEALKKKNSRLLALSGTPFNIIDDYGDNVYTWDYIMEQKAKEEWDILHPGDINPYRDLPRMNIFTFDIGNEIPGYIQTDLEGKAFNFREFFRVWTGNPDQDRHSSLPEGAKIGEFVHKDHVKAFLDLISKPNESSFYPYATQEFRDMFKHTLWIVPGVKEAKALSAMLKEHDIFMHFGIANVAGDGDIEQPYDDALKQVRATIADHDYSITLSCGKLTTGVTVKEWTAVMMLAGSSTTAAAGYMQTIFRVQSAGVVDGKQKENVYVFDFAPDRTIKVLADVMDRTAARRGDSSNKETLMGEFINYCPIISITGTKMRTYDVTNMMGQLKRIFVERAIRSGFDDSSIYDGKRLLQLTELEANDFEGLKKIIGSSKAAERVTGVKINGQGFDQETYNIAQNARKKKPKELTPEEKAAIEKLKKAREDRKAAISILRGISIRMPMLIYGSDVPFDQDISIEDFVNMVDEESWKEFMPQGLTKDKFKNYLKYYDKNVFITAGREIRRLTKEADDMTPTDRVISIARLFSYFKNPDKETVLTPWRVVNIHMSNTLGGYNFWDDDFTKESEVPHMIRNGAVTNNTLGNGHAHILEINSKSGLYPLYCAYSIYRAKLGGLCEEDLKEEALKKLWKETITENIFVICKTPMARSITKRTLCGYRDIQANTIYYKNLMGTLENHPEQFVRSTTDHKIWGMGGKGMLKLEAICSNPPYQTSDSGFGVSAAPVYHQFVRAAKSLTPDYISMIMPARWYIGGKGLDTFREEFLNDEAISKLVDYENSKELFPSADIAGGVCYFLWDKEHKGDCVIYNALSDQKQEEKRSLHEYQTLVRSNYGVQIVRKVLAQHEGTMLSDRVSSRKPFNLGTSYKPVSSGIPCWFIQKIGMKYAKETDVEDPFDLLNKWKLLIPKAPIAGQTDFSKPVGFYYEGNTRIAKPGECCTESWIVAGAFDTEEAVLSYKSYLFTKIVRFLLLQAVISQDVTKKNFAFVPDLGHYEGTYTDEMLMEKWGITDEEWQYISSRIHNYESQLKAL